MEQRLANTWRMSLNEKKFIEAALLSNFRVDGRRPFDYRELTINFGREDGSSEVQLGQTRIMAFVTAQLVQPYRDRPNEGSFAIYTEFSPMADPTFEAGCPGESAVELGRVIDRGLRESRAVDTESLCVLAGKLVWSIRIDLLILDNGGNLVDAANIAALAALMTFRTPECTLMGEDGEEVIVHPPEVQEPLPLIVHHLPIAVTFAFITEDNIVVVDPTYHEEAIMKGRMTATVNANEDVCAIQKAGGVGVMPIVVMQCLRLAAMKASDITSKIKDAVESYNAERALRRVKHLPSVATLNISLPHSGMEDKNQFTCEKTVAREQPEKSASEAYAISESNCMQIEEPSSTGNAAANDHEARNFTRGPSCWDPYSKGVDSELLRASLASRGKSMHDKEDNRIAEGHLLLLEVNPAEPVERKSPLLPSTDASDVRFVAREIKTLKDAVKPKNKRKKVSSTSNTS